MLGAETTLMSHEAQKGGSIARGGLEAAERFIAEWPEVGAQRSGQRRASDVGGAQRKGRRGSNRRSGRNRDQRTADRAGNSRGRGETTADEFEARQQTG